VPGNTSRSGEKKDSGEVQNRKEILKSFYANMGRKSEGKKNFPCKFKEERFLTKAHTGFRVQYAGPEKLVRQQLKKNQKRSWRSVIKSARVAPRESANRCMRHSFVLKRKRAGRKGQRGVGREGNKCRARFITGKQRREFVIEGVIPVWGAKTHDWGGSSKRL